MSQVVPLRHLAAVRVSNVDKKSVDGQPPVRLCNYTDVYYGDRITPDLDLMPATATPDQLRSFRLIRGDVIITKDSEDPWDIGVPAYVAESAPDIVCGYHLAVIRPTPERSDGRYLFWAMASQRVQDHLSVNATGITRYGLRTESILASPISRWPIERQRAIADYLDAETARIDALIAKKRRLIEVLDERLPALVRRVIADAGATDSVKLRHICHVKRGQSPRPIDDWSYFDEAGTHGWVRIEDVTKAGMYLRSTRERLSALGKSRSVPVGPGMVLVSIAASIGKPVITDMDCCYHDGFVGLRRLSAEPEFVYWCLLLPEAFGGLGNLGTQANINSDIVGEIRIPLLDSARQQAVVDEIEMMRRRQDELLRRVHDQIDLLVEHRQALITAAVSGELEVAA